MTDALRRCPAPPRCFPREPVAPGSVPLISIVSLRPRHRPVRARPPRPPGIAPQRGPIAVSRSGPWPRPSGSWACAVSRRAPTSSSGWPSPSREPASFPRPSCNWFDTIRSTTPSPSSAMLITGYVLATGFASCSAATSTSVRPTPPRGGRARARPRAALSALLCLLPARLGHRASWCWRANGAWPPRKQRTQLRYLGSGVMLSAAGGVTTNLLIPSLHRELVLQLAGTVLRRARSSCSPRIPWFVIT